MRRFLSLLGCLIASMTTGCIATQVSPGDLELHGKVGWVCSLPAGVVGGALDVVCLPVTLPIGIIKDSGPSSHDTPPAKLIAPIAPGFVLECLVYEAGTALAYPVKLAVVDLPRQVRLAWFTDRASLDGHLLRLPELSVEDYAKLVAASRRQYAPSYIPADPNRLLPLSGYRKGLDRWVLYDWRTWERAGRPAGGAEEAALVLNCWVIKRDPQTAYLYYGEKQMQTIVRAAGVSCTEVVEYAEQHVEGREAAGQGPWKFWINQHGGVEEVAERSQDNGPK